MMKVNKKFKIYKKTNILINYSNNYLNIYKIIVKMKSSLKYY